MILDCGHNVPSIEALIATLRDEFPEVADRWVVLACSADKQYREMLHLLAGYFTDFVLTRYLNNPRSLAPEKMAELLIAADRKPRYRIEPTPHSAWNVAYHTVKHNDLLCITGSIFLAGELIDTVYQESSQQQSVDTTCE